MSPFVTEHTAPQFWPGKNLLGSMLTAMAQHLTSPSETESPISQSQGDSLDTPLDTPLAQSSEASQPVEPRGPMENMSENLSCIMDANTTDIHEDVGPNFNQPSANSVKPPVEPPVKQPELTPVASSGGPSHLSRSNRRSPTVLCTTRSYSPRSRRPATPKPRENGVLHQDIRTSFPRTENVKRKTQASSPDQTDSVSKVHKADNDVH